MLKKGKTTKKKNGKTDDRLKICVRVSKTLRPALNAFCKKKGISQNDYVESLISKSLKKN